MDKGLRKLNSDEIKEIQLSILRYVSELCDQNGIKYFLDSGTLLGAVRHKGYIPWDDDIDIGMLREDYEKFIRLMSHKSNSRFQFKCYELDCNHLYAFGKMIDTSTVLFEPDENGIKTAINIDVFPYDNVPDNNNIISRMVKKRNRYRLLNQLRNGLILPSSPIKKMAIVVSKSILSIFPKDYFIIKMIANEKKYINVKTKKIANLYGVSDSVANRSVFRKYIAIEFEGEMYNVPVDYDMWLKINYGNYMELPPEEKRVSHHSYKAYRK